MKYVVFHDHCVEVNGLLYYREPYNLGAPYEIKDPWQMHVLEVTADRIIVELTQIIVYPVYGAFEDVSTMELLCVNGKWRIVKQGFMV